MKLFCLSFFLERFVEAEDSISFFFVFCFEQTFGFPRLLRAPMCGCEKHPWRGVERVGEKKDAAVFCLSTLRNQSIVGKGESTRNHT